MTDRPGHRCAQTRNSLDLEPVGFADTKDTTTASIVICNDSHAYWRRCFLLLKRQNYEQWLAVRNDFKSFSKELPVMSLDYCSDCKNQILTKIQRLLQEVKQFLFLHLWTSHEPKGVDLTRRVVDDIILSLLVIFSGPCALKAMFRTLYGVPTLILTTSQYG